MIDALDCILIVWRSIGLIKIDRCISQPSGQLLNEHEKGVLKCVTSKVMSVAIGLVQTAVHGLFLMQLMVLRLDWQDL